MEMQAKGVLVDSIRSRYYNAREKDKSRILDQIDTDAARQKHADKHGLLLCDSWFRDREQEGSVGPGNASLRRLSFNGRSIDQRTSRKVSRLNRLSLPE